MDYELRRSISDIQSKISSLDHKVLRMSAGAPAGSRPGRPGQQLILKAAAQLARVSGNAFLFDALEQKAATAPAMTGVSTWAAEFVAAASFPGLVLSLERQSAIAAIMVKSPQVSVLGVGQQGAGCRCRAAGENRCRGRQHPCAERLVCAVRFGAVQGRRDHGL
jgi:hypothetical protein